MIVSFLCKSILLIYESIYIIFKDFHKFLIIQSINKYVILGFIFLIMFYYVKKFSWIFKYKKNDPDIIVSWSHF